MNIAILTLESANLKLDLKADELKQIKGGNAVQVAIAGTGGAVFQNVGGNFATVIIPGQAPQIWRLNPDGTTTLIFS